MLLLTFIIIDHFVVIADQVPCLLGCIGLDVEHVSPLHQVVKPSNLEVVGLIPWHLVARMGYLGSCFVVEGIP